jgi:hypothetical protein
LFIAHAYKGQISVDKPSTGQAYATMVAVLGLKAEPVVKYLAQKK